MDQRPPPEVTIRDPARPARPVDVLVIGDEAPVSPAVTRPRATAAGAVLVLLAGLVAAGDVRERERAAAEELRLASVVQLRLDAGDLSGSGTHDRQTDTATLGLTLPVHNDGPRDVLVVSGGVAGYGLARPVEVRAGGRQVLRLTQTVQCARLTDRPAASAEVLELSVRTPAGVQPRRVELPLPSSFVDDHTQHLCGFVPLDVATTLALVDVRSSPRMLRVTVEVRNTARRPVRVVAVRAPAPGFEATTQELTAGPIGLPLVVGEGVGSTTIQVGISVVDCAAATAIPEPLGLVVTVEDDRHGQALPPLPLDPPLRQALVDNSC